MARVKGISTGDFVEKFPLLIALFAPATDGWAHSVSAPKKRRQEIRRQDEYFYFPAAPRRRVMRLLVTFEARVSPGFPPLYNISEDFKATTVERLTCLLRYDIELPYKRVRALQRHSIYFDGKDRSNCHRTDRTTSPRALHRPEIDI